VDRLLCRLSGSGNLPSGGRSRRPALPPEVLEGQRARERGNPFFDREIRSTVVGAYGKAGRREDERALQEV